MPRSPHGAALFQQLVSWSLMSLFSTNMAISETKIISTKITKFQGSV